MIENGTNMVKIRGYLRDIIFFSVKERNYRSLDILTDFTNMSKKGKIEALRTQFYYTGVLLLFSNLSSPNPPNVVSLGEKSDINR